VFLTRSSIGYKRKQGYNPRLLYRDREGALMFGACSGYASGQDLPALGDKAA
jgi:hypothetical protein